MVAEVTAPDPLTGLVRVSGEALDGSYVSCLNEDSAAGVIVQADDRGRYSLDIAAEVGDSLSIWQHLGTERGPYQHVQVPAPR